MRVTYFPCEWKKFWLRCLNTIWWMALFSCQALDTFDKLTNCPMNFFTQNDWGIVQPLKDNRTSTQLSNKHDLLLYITFSTSDYIIALLCQNWNMEKVSNCTFCQWHHEVTCSHKTGEWSTVSPIKPLFIICALTIACHKNVWINDALLVITSSCTEVLTICKHIFLCTKIGNSVL